MTSAEIVELMCGKGVNESSGIKARKIENSVPANVAIGASRSPNRLK